MPNNGHSTPQPIKLKLKLGGTNQRITQASPNQHNPTGNVNGNAEDEDEDDWDEDDLLRSIEEDRSNVAGPSSSATPNSNSGTSGSKGLKLKLNLTSSKKSSTSTSTPSKTSRSTANPESTPSATATNAPTPTPTLKPKIKFNLKRPLPLPLLTPVSSSKPGMTDTEEEDGIVHQDQDRTEPDEASDEENEEEKGETYPTAIPTPLKLKLNAGKKKEKETGKEVVGTPTPKGIPTPTTTPRPRIKVKLPSSSSSSSPAHATTTTTTPRAEEDSQGAGRGDSHFKDLQFETPVKNGKKTKLKLKNKPASLPATPSLSTSSDISISRPNVEADVEGEGEPTSTSTPTPSSISMTTPARKLSFPENLTPTSPNNSPSSGKSVRVTNGARAGGRPPKKVGVGKSKLRQEVGLDVDVGVGGDADESESKNKEARAGLGMQVEAEERETVDAAVKQESSGEGEGMGGHDVDVHGVKRESEDGVGQAGQAGKVDDARGMDLDHDKDNEQDNNYDNDNDQEDNDDQDQDDDENNADSMAMDIDVDDPTSTPTSGTSRPNANPHRIPGGKGGGRNKKPFAFRKKPLGHLLTTIIGNLRRKDAYGLFFDPVSLEEYPNYFEVIGGEDKAMDLGTMEDKVGRGEYKQMSEFENDVEKMITAAQKFNPDDTLVHREAAKVAQLAERQFNRFRSLVKTPEPSPEREPSGLRTPGDRVGGSVGPTPSNRSVSPTGTTYKDKDASTVEKSAVSTLLPRQLVPECMLDYPPNSDVARCVGWYLSGGKRPRTKKEQRAKEKWDGTWREWNVDGDRNVREADNVLDLLRDGFTFQTSGLGVTLPRTVDWQDELMNASETWQPTPTLTGVVVDETIPQIPTRPIDHLDMGRYQNLAGSYGFPEFKRYDPRKFIRDLTVDLESVWRDEDDEPILSRDTSMRDRRERPGRVIKEMCLGEEVTSEAYVRSIQAFVSGARAEGTGVELEGGGRKRKRERDEMDDNENNMLKIETKIEDDSSPASSTPAPSATYDASGFDLGMPLEDYINTKWRDGWLNAGVRGTVKRTQETYREIINSNVKAEAEPDSGQQAKKPKLEEVLKADSLDVEAIIRELYYQTVKDSIKRVPIALEIEEYSARHTGLDLACLLVTPNDFAAGGSTNPPPNTGPGRAVWYEKSLRSVGEQLVEASKRREGLDEDGLKSEEEEEKMRKLRLDLLSLGKNVPVYELRPMTHSELAKLPQAVRGLIKVVDKS